jgi:polyisoprenoid-binding protein YceI
MRLSSSLFAASLLVSSPALAAPEQYALDMSHTNVLFFVSHLGFSDTVGRFDDVTGTLTLDEENPEQSKVEVVIKPASVDTQSAELNRNLQAPEWFNTEKFPEIRFTSTAVKRTGESTADVKGNLTFMGVTKPITLKAKLNKVDYFPMAKAWIAGFNAETSLKRSEFGMNNYVPMIGDDIRLIISTEFHNKEKPAPKRVAKKK